MDERFQQLVSRWSEDTSFMSSMSDMVAHPAYLEIIEMGERAVPLLLLELKNRSGHWFSALSTITGENPIPAESRGRFEEMSEAWLDWGRRNGYLDA